MSGYISKSYAKTKLYLALIFIYLIVFQSANAQISEFKIIASDGAASDEFGLSVSNSGEYAVVGAIFDSDNGSNSGSAYVFKRSGTSWAQEAKLLPVDGAASDWFGSSVSISGDYVVVGAEQNDDNGDRSGSAYVFKRSGTIWTQEAKLLAFDGAVNDDFGFSVSISGDYTIVGAAFNDDSGINSGSAYVFKRSGTSWAQEAKLLPVDGAAGDQFGYSVAISGDYTVVGARYDDDNGDRSGSAYVFKRSGTSWTQEEKLFASDGAVNDIFGLSVSISGDYVVVGAAFDDDSGINSGSAYVFKRTGTSWAQEVKLLPVDGAAGDQFGYSVAISGDYTVVGANLDNDNATDAGSAYVFKRTGTSWAQETKLLAFDGAADDLFGLSVSISGDYTIVGAAFDDDSGLASGSAYLYNGFTSTVSVESEKAGIPVKFSLSQNYPNPFNPVTVIEYTLPIRFQVKLIVYDLRSQEVARLIDSTLPAGTHSVTWDASNVSSGIYFYRLQAGPTSVWRAGDFVLTRKMVLLK